MTVELAEVPTPTDPAPEPLLAVRDTSGKVVFTVTAEAVWLNPDAPAAEVGRLIIEAVNGHFSRGAESRGLEVMQLQATCWQLSQQRDQIFAELQKRLRQGIAAA